jgi:hypothetical protein
MFLPFREMKTPASSPLALQKRRYILYIGVFNQLSESLNIFILSEPSEHENSNTFENLHQSSHFDTVPSSLSCSLEALKMSIFLISSVMPRQGYVIHTFDKNGLS